MSKYKADAYLRLSYSADHSVESDSIANQENICQGGFHRKGAVPIKHCPSACRKAACQGNVQAGRKAKKIHMGRKEQERERR